MGQAMRDDGFEAYKVAREINPEYVKHPLFTKGFLRAEDYHTEKAARRIFTYLRIKLELFGRDKLTRDILLDDLGEDGRAYLESGALQILPKRDTSGRRVIFGVGRLNGKGTPRQVLSAVSVPLFENRFVRKTLFSIQILRSILIPHLVYLLHSSKPTEKGLLLFHYECK